MEESLQILSSEFKSFKDPRATPFISLHDMLMSSFAVFSLKYPSLLKFDNDRREASPAFFENLKRVYKVERVPSDTQLRDIVDLVEVSQFRKSFLRLFRLLQRNKSLESFEYMRVAGRSHYVLSVDGTGYFRSDKVGCASCNNYESKENRKVKKYGHNILGGSIVHPERKEVIPLCPEPILVQDGGTKNDCEQNAFKRFIKHLKREHPKLDCILSLDALYANEPTIKLLFEKEYHFLISVKETQSALYRQVNEGEASGKTQHYEYTFEIGDKVKKQVIRRFRYASNLHLNQDPRSTKVNFIEFWEEISWEGKRGPEVKKVHFAWITDLPVKQENLIKLMQGGRARWKIENETFNTLKNQGYNIEHNYGHGKDFLSVNFIMMMFLAFFVDEIQRIACSKYKATIQKLKRRSYLRSKILALYDWLKLESADDIFKWFLKLPGHEKLPFFNST